MFGLDLLRCLLMLIGPIVHTGAHYSSTLDIVGNTHLTIANISHFSHPFRMELFFLISGFFSALVLEKKGLQYYKNSRIYGLFLPTVTAMLLILPLTRYVFTSLSSLTPMTFFHTWFLIVLSILSTFVLLFAKHFSAAAKRLSHLNIVYVVLVGIILYILALFIPVVLFKLMPTDRTVVKDMFYTLVSMPLQYTVPFLGGAVLYYRRDKTIIKWNLLLVVGIYLVVYTLTCTFPYGGNLTEKAVSLALQLLQVLIATWLILALFYYFKALKVRPSKTLQFVTSSALTVFLIHQPITFALGSLFTRIPLNPYIEFLLICIGVYIFSFLFFYLIKKAKITRLLFGIKNTSGATKKYHQLDSPIERQLAERKA